MDLWSNQNLAPFMAVTSHWIHVTKIRTSDGPEYILKLRADLVGFQHVPRRHTGKHLCDAFLQVVMLHGNSERSHKPFGVI